MDSDFHKLADDILERMFDRYDSLLECELLNGILSIKLLDGKEYIINKHQPTRQIWLSSPFSGAHRFNGEEIFEFLGNELHKCHKSE